MAAIPPAQPSQILRNTSRKLSSEELLAQAQATFASYLKSPPEGYMHRRTHPPASALQSRQAKYVQNIRTNQNESKPDIYNKRPNTQEFFESKMAREKPADGDDAMNEADQCLTCIVQGTICHGTKVSKGKCNSCRGLNEDGTRKRGIRHCRWSEPGKGVFTYLDHKERYPNGRVVKATSADSDTNDSDSGGDSNGEPEVFSDVAHVFITVRDISQPYVQQLLRVMVATVFDGGWASSDAESNTQALSSLAWACWKALDTEDEEYKAAVEEVSDCLSNMLHLKDFVSYREMVELLPTTHPVATNTDRGPSREQEVEETIDINSITEMEFEYAGYGSK